MDNVKEQLVVGIPAMLFGYTSGRIDADHDFTFEEILRFGRVKTDHVGRVIVVEKLPIDSVDFWVVDNGKRYLPIAPTIIFRDHFDGLDQERAWNTTNGGATVDLNRDSHGKLERIGNDCGSRKLVLSENLFVLRKVTSSSKGAYVRNPREERQN